jgi:uncharacterized protein (TIGR02594 family)
MSISWVEFAKRHIGVDENKDAALIKSWIKEMGPDWFYKTFEAPKVAWCGVFVAWCLRSSNVEALPSLYMRASDWISWGQPLERPVEGCVAIYERTGGGHVGIVVGQTTDGSVVCIGGNQSNKVCLASFDKNRAVQYRWPGNGALEAELPVVALNASHSTNEA